MPPRGTMAGAVGASPDKLAKHGRRLGPRGAVAQMAIYRWDMKLGPIIEALIAASYRSLELMS